MPKFRKNPDMDEAERKNQEMIIIQLASAVVHLQEYIDTDEPLDLAAAESNLSHPVVEQWMADNKVLLPMRRDDRG